MVSFDKKLLWLSSREIHIKNGAFSTDFEPCELISLTESIFENGILKPLIVRKVSIKGYELVSGFRRLLAAKKLRLRRVPCIVCVADDKEAALIRLSDNLCRVSPSYLNKAKEIKAAIQTYNFLPEELATKIGVSTNRLKQLLDILKLDELTLQRLQNENISEEFAVLILNTKPQLRQNALDMIISESLSIKRAEKLISSMSLNTDTSALKLDFIQKREEIFATKEQLRAPKEVPSPIKAQIGDMRLFSNSLTRLVDTMKNAGVKIKSSTTETKKYTEYKVRIEKNTACPEAVQLKMSLR